ncbi:acetyl-CoA synthetase-like protein [Rhodocollybia butyracea]|uniref:Acetyl-CoA synthetase-like protein n=1 Tax=Rhodocollybia butyracea TaxID=206335 RepID=A0A9P5PH64_9AGAR|nr:acetyl-CoA synthetase-like protein [Rhodocollybia butyracea]
MASLQSAPLKTHLTILKDSSERFSHLPAFKIPSEESTSSGVPRWDTITFKQFYDDVESCAKYWSQELGSRVPLKSVVGLWIGGFTYFDVLHIYGVSRAGYVPQLFSLRLPNPTVIYELLQKASASALICDSVTSGFIVGETPVPVLQVPIFSDIDTSSALSPSLLANDPLEIAFVFHTSGSTSGSPKLVPCNYQWLDAAARKASQLCVPMHSDRQDVSTWMGSMAHIGQTTMLINLMQYGTCIIQPRRMPFATEELVDMIKYCNLNRLWQFPAFFSAHLRVARKDPSLLSMLVNLDEITTAGMALAPEDEAFAYNAGIKLRNIFGSTECGGSTLRSVGGSDPATRHHLRPLQGLSYAFVPISSSTPEDHQSTARLHEFVVLSDSGDCPDVSLRQADGHFHTGDLFQVVGPDSYIFAGRDDDWIKTENSLRCDTKSIEDNARAMCGALVSECIVVGAGRPSPVLFVETDSKIDESKLKKDIFRKIRQFHSRRYIHESITSAKMIIVVPKGTLPRTASKGNIRRKAVEEAYRAQLDEVYGVVY